MIESLNRVEISLPALCHNFRLLKDKGAGLPVLAMVKADGYGHGMIACAGALAAAGADCFGVAEAVEGVLLRRQGIKQPILIVAGILPEIIPALFDHLLTPVVVDGSLLQAISAEAVLRNQDIELHLKVDAGMGRQGCMLADMGGLVAKIYALPGLKLAGIMAHFPMADDPKSDSTNEITALFCRELENIRALLPKNILIHLANSGATLYFSGTHQDMIRPGISLYGYYPNGSIGRDNAAEPLLQPVMRFSSRIIQVKDVPAGTGLGYGQTFVTSKPTRIALIPVGYEDGYLRGLSNAAQGLIHGQRVSVVGRISMNLTMFDITDLDGIQAGDEVVLLGRQENEEITADEISRWMGTINYEILCLFGNLNHRVYVES